MKKVNIVEMGMEIGTISFDSKSNYWNSLEVLELPGTILCYDSESNSLEFEGVAGPGCKCDGCTQDNCATHDCQYCPYRTMGNTERLFLPANSVVDLY